MVARPPPDVAIDDALVRALLAEQHADLAALPLHGRVEGWDNVVVRLGDELAVRLPRREVAVPLLEKEQRWLAHLAPRLPLRVPHPVRLGAASARFARPWSVVPWLPGTTADRARPAAREAETLARFLRALHVAAPAEAPMNPLRGVPLSARATLGRLRERVRDDPVLAAVWNGALAAAPARAPTWIHGDLHARNVLVDDRGALAAVLDWGDLCAGDPATDLATCWTVLHTAAARERFVAAYAPDADTWRRARGWALVFADLLDDALALAALTDGGVEGAR